MKRATILCLLLGCSRSIELLPPKAPMSDASSVDGRASREDVAVGEEVGSEDASTDLRARGSYSFCPTAIDVYGGTNTLFPGCGGPVNPPSPVEDGFFAPGNVSYDATLAGRLLARLVGDPDLEPRFGSAWTVRSCATPSQSLSHLVPTLPADLCGRGAPELMASTTTVCTKKPAPLFLLPATMTDDGCHGGVSGIPDDAATYIQHFKQRMDTFLKSRSPFFALLGARTEWVDAANFSGTEACLWRRLDWDRLAIESWFESRDTAHDGMLLPNLHATFKRHHRCCRTLDADCGSNWFNRGEVVNCDGAQALVNFWYQHLKSFLLTNDFMCPT